MAIGYIDPGTAAPIFAFMAPLVSILLVFLGYLLWPFRTVFRKLFRRSQKAEEHPDHAADENHQPATTE